MFKQIIQFALLVSMGMFNSAVYAQSTTIIGPTGSEIFGSGITILTNGNYVVIDPLFDNGATIDVGAVYLYDGITHTVISTLKGSSANDKIGSGSIVILPNGNFVVRSTLWDNGAATDAGAVTWVNGVTGLSGVVSPTNSLVGTTSSDNVGSYGIYVLPNGNYIVISSFWDNGAATNAGAVTWGSGSTGISGVVSASNSLVGTSSNDFIGSSGVTVLSTNNYIVRSPSWDNGAVADVGAVTWGDGTIGVKGAISSANSLIGGSTNDYIGNYIVSALTNGNYIVHSHNFDDGVKTDVGAVTWGNGTTGITGVVSSSNSLIGSKSNDLVGSNSFAILPNGNYVFSSVNWDNGAIVDAGAVTWVNGATGMTGTLSSGNSLVGTTATDRIGSSITVLTNGNYVVRSQNWNLGALADIGAVTWGNGTTGIVGNVSNLNSYIGSTASDFIGSSGVVALTNGNYVISSPGWDNGAIANVGAVTWGNGTTGSAGTISASNSLVGSQASDDVGNGGVIALTNGNYVARSQNWTNGAITSAGAATFGNGTTGITGAVSVANSLVGSSTNNNIGSNGVLALNNGNYVVMSPGWDTGAVNNVGAATWGNGTTGITGVVGSANSLVGSTASDQVGGNITALTNGNYVVRGTSWDNAAIINAGAVTFGNGTTGIKGFISSSNSLVGNTANDQIGSSFSVLTNGNYVIRSSSWDNGAIADAGAITWGNGISGISGTVSISNSLVGAAANDFIGSGTLQTISDGNFMLKSVNWDNGALADAGAATWGNGSSGIVGTINSCNSVMSGVANGSINNVYHDSFKYMIVGKQKENQVIIYNPKGMQLAMTNDSASLSVSGGTAVQFVTNANCKIIASLTANGASPAAGSIQSKVWFESSVPKFGGKPFVARHYQILPANNASAATGKITLFFTQQEFNDYNSDSGSILDLPTGANDATGKGNLKIGKFNGVSSDGTGLPATYSGSEEVIDPIDADIIWNNALSRWEVTFATTGFGGYILKSSATPPNSISSMEHKYLEVYPNPSNDGLFNIVFNNANTNARSIQLTDLQGRNIKALNIEGNGKQSIDISEQESGIYLLKIENGEVYKLIKN